MAYTLEQLFKNKALDAFFTPIYMKKNRPAYRLTVVCKEENLQAMQDIIFKQTTTIGMRYRREQRAVLDRQIKEADTPYGKIRVKEVSHQGNTYLYPEYEDLKRIADEKGIAIKELYTLFK